MNSIKLVKWMVIKMEFEMNSRKWEILEVSEEELRKIYQSNYGKDVGSEIKFYGSTYDCIQKIYINKDLCKEAKRQTIIHELIHCYINCYCFDYEKGYGLEDICNISACSHDIIHDLIERYFKNN